MSKYIKLDDAIDALYSGFVTKTYIENKLKELPTIDIVECEECRWRDVCSQVVSDIGCEVDTLLRWCSDGERIDNE